MNWFTFVLILSKTARGFGPTSPALFEEVIDPVQSKKADEDHRDRLPQLILPRSNGCCMKSSPRVETGRLEANPFDCAKWQSFCSSRGANGRRCTMRDEFASNSFLAVTVAGLVLLCSSLVAIAFS